MNPAALQLLSTVAGSGVTSQAPQSGGKSSPLSLSGLASLFNMSGGMTGGGKDDSKKAMLLQLLQDQMKVPQSNFASSLTVQQPYQAGGN